MSVIDKKPFLISLIETLTEEQISALKVMMNGGGNPTVLMRTMHISPLGERTHLTAADKGIHRCNLEVDFSLLNGYLIYNDTYCVLIVFTDFQTLSWYTIDVENQEIAKITEELSILELRSELDDSSAAEKAEIISTVKEAIADGEIKVVTLENGTNFTNLSDELLDSLKAGDIVTKQDETGKHAYMVSYKKDGTGICLTYSDASRVETVSYDYIDGHWVYNSTDVVPTGDNNSAPAYSASATYAVGDLVLYDNVLYECTVAVESAEAFDPTKWTRTTVAGAILGMINGGY